jgi:hypothetical protein
VERQLWFGEIVQVALEPAYGRLLLGRFSDAGTHDANHALSSLRRDGGDDAALREHDLTVRSSCRDGPQRDRWGLSACLQAPPRTPAFGLTGAAHASRDRLASGRPHP